MAGRIAVVTDSTAYLPDALIASSGLTIVPLTVVIAGAQRREGVEVSPAEVAQALGARRPVSTSRPSPAAFVAEYRRLLADGAAGVVSVHLSAELSGTFDAARLAAEEVGAQVTVVDSRSAGMGLGFPALAAASAAVAGADLSGVRGAACAAIERTTTLFYVDTLEFLRRGGRIGAASALLGTALAVKPILRLSEAGIVVQDKVRTAGRALARLADLAVAAAGESPALDLAVHHLAAPHRADALAEAVAKRLGARLCTTVSTEVGAAVGAHVGAGVVCVVVYRR